MRWKRVVYVSILYTLEVLSVLNIIPAIIGAVAGIGSAAIGMASARSSAKAYQQGAQEANDRQYEIAKENREFERDTAYEMMQRRHQWEVADLRAAGLNPILSAHSAPSMGNVSADTPPIQNTQAQAIEAGKVHAASAQQLFQNILAARQQKNLNNVAETQSGYNSAQTAKTNADIEETYQRMKANLPKAQANYYSSSARNLDEQSLNLARTRDLIGVQIERERATVKELEAKREELIAQIQLIYAQKQQVGSHIALNYAQRDLTRTENELNRHRIRSEQLGQAEQMLTNAGLLAGLSEQKFWQRIHDEGNYALDSFQWIRSGIRDFLKDVDESFHNQDTEIRRRIERARERGEIDKEERKRASDEHYEYIMNRGY